MSADPSVLVGRIIKDEKFAEQLVQNPEQTLREAKIEPTIDLLQALRGVDAKQLKTLASAFRSESAAC